MKIEYSPAGADDWETLADESVSTLGAAISGFAPSFTLSPMVTPAYGAAVPVALDMGNGQWKVGFTVERLHASPDAAQAFIQAEPLNYVGNQDLRITVGEQVTYLANCVRTEVVPDPHSDQSSKIRYGFGYGSYQTSEP